MFGFFFMRNTSFRLLWDDSNILKTFINNSRRYDFDSLVAFIHWTGFTDFKACELIKKKSSSTNYNHTEKKKLKRQEEECLFYTLYIFLFFSNYCQNTKSNYWFVLLSTIKFFFLRSIISRERSILRSN